MKIIAILGFISAETLDQANQILDALLAKKLITGGIVLNGPAKFWWKGKIASMDYYYIMVYTVDRHKETLIIEVKKASIEEVPMISFVPFEGNEELLQWVSQNI